MLKELIKVIQQEHHSYKDPVTEFLECLYVNYVVVGFWTIAGVIWNISDVVVGFWTASSWSDVVVVLLWLIISGAFVNDLASYL